MGILLLGKGHRLQQLAEFTPSSSDYLQNRATGLNKQVTRKEPDPWPSWGRFAQLLQHKAVTKPAQTAVGGFPWRKRIPEWQRATKATPTQSHSLVPRNPWQLGRHNGARSTCYHSERPKGCSIGQWMAKGAPSIFGSPFGSAQRLAFITSIPSRRCTVGMCAGGTARAPCVAVLSDLRVRGDVERGKKEAWRPAGGRILEAEPGFSALSVRAHWSQLRWEPPSGNL